jgi:2-dehydro-3-deoxygalactonokinase
MTAETFIAGDWGTSVLRLYLCRRVEHGGAEVLDQVRGPGIKAGGDFESALFAAAAPWLAQHGPLGFILGGMVGSTIGWRNVPYVPCPAGPAEIAAGTARFELRGSPIAIAPGLSCTNIFGLADVLRGEEVQMLGFNAGGEDGASAHHLICLPGTHAKWAFSRGAQIQSFFTSMQGELHEVLLANSLLGRTIGAAHVTAWDDPAFDDGLARMRADPSLALQHALFSLRARTVLGELRSEAGAAYLSGLLIGADVRDALAACNDRGLTFNAVALIGSDRLVDLYARALAVWDQSVPVRRMSDRDASVRGLALLMNNSF